MLRIHARHSNCERVSWSKQKSRRIVNACNSRMRIFYMTTKIKCQIIELNNMEHEQWEAGTNEIMQKWINKICSRLSETLKHSVCVCSGEKRKYWTFQWKKARKYAIYKVMFRCARNQFKLHMHEPRWRFKLKWRRRQDKCHHNYIDTGCHSVVFRFVSFQFIFGVSSFDCWEKTANGQICGENWANVLSNIQGIQLSS